MTSRRVVLDLVQDSQLHTEFLPDGVIRHTHIRSNPGTQQRCERYTETWTTRTQAGRGGFATVWLQYNEHGQTRAVKQIHKQTTYEGLDPLYEIEVAMRYSHHRYVHCFIQSHGWFEDPNSFYISMEYFPHGDLNKFLAKSSLTETESQIITSQIIEGLSFMHSNGVLHRDVKPSNILIVQVQPDWWVKLGDFSISRRTEENTSIYNNASTPTRVGTVGYMAPELLVEPGELSHPLATAIDIWALGETVHRLLTGKPAFDSLLALFRFTTTKATFEGLLLVEQAVSSEAFKFVKALLNPEPGLRLTIELALSHPWLNGLTTRLGSADPPLPNQAWTSPHQENHALIEATRDLTTKAWTTHSMESLLRSPPVSSVLIRMTGYVKSNEIHMPQTAVIQSASASSAASAVLEAATEPESDPEPKPEPELEPSEATNEPAPTVPGPTITEIMTQLEVEMTSMRQDTNRVLRQLAMATNQHSTSQVRQNEAQEGPESLEDLSALLSSLPEPTPPAETAPTSQRPKFSWRRLTRRAKVVSQPQGTETHPSK